MIRNISIALAGAAMLAAPTAYAAENKTEVVGVSIADLDLATKEGRDELDKRIDDAAKKVCGLDDANTGSRISSRASRQCYRDAKQDMDDHFAEIVADRQRGG